MGIRFCCYALVEKIRAGGNLQSNEHQSQEDSRDQASAVSINQCTAQGIACRLKYPAADSEQGRAQPKKTRDVEPLPRARSLDTERISEDQRDEKSRKRHQDDTYPNLVKARRKSQVALQTVSIALDVNARIYDEAI